MLLIVEDDEHKSTQIIELMKQLNLDLESKVIDNVRDAVVYLKSITPLKLILDMSLPSHKAQSGQGIPLPMPNGGMEILFELKKRNLLPLPILILTQYPEIEIEGDPIPVNDSPKIIAEEYGFTQLQACHYEQLPNANWKGITINFLRN